MQTPPTPTHDERVGGSFAPDLHDARHLWLKAVLLLVWALVSFGTCFFARDLQALMPQRPLAYLVSAQGVIPMFLGIVLVYCVAMNHFERKESLESKGEQDGAAIDSATDSTLHG